MPASYQTLHEYYRNQSVLPTYGGFRSWVELRRHEAHRRRLFTDKLFLPPRLFRGAELIEFGPDAGENALVFASWGARCTFVEPNPKAVPVLRRYFRQFRLTQQFTALWPMDIRSVAENPPRAHFDVIDAEGFIYTVKPSSLWVRLFSRLAADEGFVILFYYERFGSFFELLQKAVYAEVRRRTGLAPLEAARAAYQTKWDSIPHKRTMESWAMDVLENPFVRLRFFLEPTTLCRKFAHAGLPLYSSWPPYRDGLDVCWFKRERRAAEELRLQEDFIRQSRLSHVFGRRLFLRQASCGLDAEMKRLLAAVDALIDGVDARHVEVARRILVGLSSLLDEGCIVGLREDVAEARRAVGSIVRLLDLLGRGCIGDLLRFCHRDRAFIEYWGMPSHFAVFRKSSESRGNVAT